MADGSMRHLPVYLLLDCSGSMIGAPIEAVNEGLGMIYHTLMKDPQAVETVYMSVIRFAEAAEQEDLTPLIHFVPPTLVAGGPTAMGSAFHVLVESIQNDLTISTQSGEVVRRGDFCPLVFLLTDGYPTDEWQSEVVKLKALHGNQAPTIVALGCGDEVDGAMLKQVTDSVFLMKDVNSEQLRAFCKWISGSIVSVTHTMVGGATTAGIASPVGVVPGVIPYVGER